MSEKRNINLTIADIPLNLNISAADEEIIRKAAKEINERVLKYKTGNTEPDVEWNKIGTSGEIII